jgi:UDP-N-acetylglucosamine 2-epimerase (non-hydrolysing)
MFAGSASKPDSTRFMKKPIGILVGTRPEVIKMAPVFAALRESPCLRPVWISTGQHRQMLDQAMAVFGLVPDYDMNLMQPGQTLADLTSRVIGAVTQLLGERSLAAVLLQGDTTTVLGSALAAFYADVPIGHVEAGLRTNNLRLPFPEEMNRRLTSPLARWNFCPTELSRENLLKEQIPADRCHVTGNTVIDSLLWVRSRLVERGIGAVGVAERLGIPTAFAERFLDDSPSGPPSSALRSTAPWVLVTGHRRESFGGGFERICEAINRLTRTFPDLGVLYPVHLNPQVQEPVRRLLAGNPRVALVSPAAYEDFIWLLDRCTFALSDSGGVQEEAPSLGKPVLVMRETTERPEGVAAGTCTLVGTDPDRILSESHRLLTDPAEYARRSALKNPYGDGRAAERIVRILEADLGS